MFRMMVAIALLGASLGAVQAQAQTAAPGDTRCWHASQSYSEGSLVRVGGKFYACGTDRNWAEAASGGPTASTRTATIRAARWSRSRTR